MTKQDNAHNPLPWTVQEYNTARFPNTGLCRIVDANGSPVPTRERETAEQIVQSCNSYYESKALISELVGVLEYAKLNINTDNRTGFGDSLFGERTLLHIDAALSKIKGGEA